MPRKRYNLNLPEDLYDRAKAEAGDVPMSRWVERAMEKALTQSATVENRRRTSFEDVALGNRDGSPRSADASDLDSGAPQRPPISPTKLRQFG